MLSVGDSSQQNYWHVYESEEVFAANISLVQFLWFAKHLLMHALCE